MAMTLDGSNGVTFNDASLQGAAASPYVLKNRIINGDMRIDQRNAGASTTNLAASQTYSLDRWLTYGTSASKFTIQQNAGSVTPPVGFANYLGITSLAATTPAATDEYIIQQRIEGFNVSDLAWGTASAKSVTLSFWVYSSLTGTFGGALQNGATNRVYVFSYSIPTANTWTQISVTIAGDTTGTWLTTTGIGLRVTFDLGTGSTYKGTAGSWGSTFYNGVTGGVNVIGTNGATFYITGVQLEQNTSATPFERRLYGQELANCQRYLPVTIGTMGSGVTPSSTAAYTCVPFPVTPRVAPTGIITTAASNFTILTGAGNLTASAVSYNANTNLSGAFITTTISGGVAGQGCVIVGGTIQFTGCEL